MTTQKRRHMPHKVSGGWKWGNIGNAIRMDVDEWLWMPINKDGRYERCKYEKYLG